MDGRVDAFDALVRTRSAALLRTAYLLTGDSWAAEDLLQTCLTTTYVHWRALRDEQAGEAYARRVMVTTYARWWRRRWRGELPTPTAAETADIDRFDAADERDLLRRALATLSRRQRACVVLRYYSDLSEAEVADLLGIAVGTVKSTTARALALLRAAHTGQEVNR